jgi:hypothetical protein
MVAFRMVSTAAAAPARLDFADKSLTKYFPRFMPRNQLISHDSDERIQGNPRKSNPHNRGISQRNGHEPRKPKRIVRTTEWAVAEREAKRLHPNAKRLSR